MLSRAILDRLKSFAQVKTYRVNLYTATKRWQTLKYSRRLAVTIKPYIERVNIFELQLDIITNVDIRPRC